MSDEKPKPAWLLKLEELGEKARKVSSDIRHKEGWKSPQEVAGMEALLHLIHEKTTRVPPGKEKAMLELINKVVYDYLWGEGNGK